MGDKREMGLAACLPEVEFEGPMGWFWPFKEVPMESLAKGAAEIIKEMLSRGYNQEIVLAMIKSAIKEEVPV